ncbi:hypothetical protein HZH68_017084 [Vespula germanica]|uniref:Odorant receptor n=1 Tax=Vespula germanica TaxID=30212 RepID=A0A834IZG8_VESGE|nr:hypothetical protein HZH68_017084 [Vespula germanica]
MQHCKSFTYGIDCNKISKGYIGNEWLRAVESMLLREEDYIDNEYYVYNRLLFRLLGLWKYQISSKQLIYVCFINLILVGGLFENIYALATSERKIESIVEILETTLPIICFGSCYCNLLFNATIMKKILFRMKCDWDDLANKPELMILKKYADISRLCTIVIAVSFYLYSAFLILPSFLSIFKYIFGFINESELILPLCLHYFQRNQMHYYLGICIQYVVVVIVTTIGIANYSMFVATIQHACGLFKIIDCQIPFYSISVKTQKMLLFLIMSSMRLCNLSVMGVKEISHDLFATVRDY